MKYYPFKEYGQKADKDLCVHARCACESIVTRDVYGSQFALHVYLQSSQTQLYYKDNLSVCVRVCVCVFVCVCAERMISQNTNRHVCKHTDAACITMAWSDLHACCVHMDPRERSICLVIRVCALLTSLMCSTKSCAHPSPVYTCTTFLVTCHGSQTPTVTTT